MPETTDTKKKNGPKSTYNPDVHCNMAIVAGKAGMTDQEFADAIGISRSVLHEWRKNFPEFKKAFKGGKKYSDDKVVKSLFERALGYQYKETEIRETDKGVFEKTTIKQMAADPTSMIFWLKNRQPEKWRDRHEINLSGKIDYQKQRKKLSDIFKKHNKE